MPAFRRSLREHLTYANVAATLAVVLALSGTAYAAGLPKDSVRSKQIKNNTVKSKDIKDAGLTGADLAPNTITGAAVDETSLGAVPDAGKLGGVAAEGYAKAVLSVVGPSFENVPLTLSVPGYGTFVLHCDDNNSNTASDDLAFYSHHSSVAVFGDDAVTTLVLTEGPTAFTGSTRVLTDYPLQSETDRSDRIAVDHHVRRADGSKSLRITARGWDDSGSGGCYGHLDAEVLR